MWPGRQVINAAIKGAVMRNLLFLSTLLFAFIAHAQWLTPAFWKRHTPTLVITTATQSIAEGLCSGAFTIETTTVPGTVVKPSSTVTVNLSGPAGVTFYSDAMCSQTTTTTLIATTATSNTVYFVDTSVSSPTLTASATGYVSATQTETVNTNNFVWTGGGADSNWTTAANWSGGAAPGSWNTALFDGTCTSNCSPTINANISVAGIRMASTYAGTITQGSGYTVALGTQNSLYGFVELAGTFIGSTAGLSIYHSVIAAGTFTAGAQTITLTGGAANEGWYVYSGATANMAGSTLYFDAGGGNYDISPSTVTYNNVEFGGGGDAWIAGANPMIIAGNVTTNSTSGWTVNGGTLDISGNVTLTNYGGTDPWSMATWVFDGSGTQTITSSASGTIGSVTFDSSGTVSILNNLNVTGAWKYVAGTVNLNGNGISFTGTSQHSVSNAIPFNDLTFNGGMSLFSGAPLTVNGNFTVGSGQTTAGWQGTVNVAGNVIINGGGNYDAEAGITMDGSGTQTLTQTGGFIPYITFNSTGTISVGSNLVVEGSWTNTAGTVNLNGYSVTFQKINWQPYHITPGSLAFNALTFYFNYAETMDLNANVTVNGELEFLDNAYTDTINGYTLYVAGTLDFYGNAAGTTLIDLDGTSAQTAMGSGTWPSGGVTDSNTAAAITQSTAMNSGGSSGLTLSGATASWNMAGYALTVNSLTLNGGTITKGGGTLTVNGTVVGTGSLYGGTVNP